MHDVCFKCHRKDGEATCPHCEDKICNLCGLSCTLGDDAPRCDYNGGLINASVSGGYFSTAGNGEGALDDGESYKFSLCEWCLDWLFSRFQKPVETASYMFVNDVPEPFKPAMQRVVEDTGWRHSKDKFFAEYERRNAAREAKK